MADDPKPKAAFDAVMCDQQYPRGVADVHIARNREFGPLLGCARVDSRHCPGNRVLVTPHRQADVAENFPDAHPLAGQPRYSWEDRGDGVLLGTLVEPAPAETPASVAARNAALVQARKLDMEARIADLTAVPEAERTEEQAGLLTRLKTFHDKLYPADMAAQSPAPAGAVPGTPQVPAEAPPAHE